MAFFEKIGEKISQTGQGVVQKTKDATETLKLNNMISEEEKKIKKCYGEIGELYFEHYSENCLPEFEEFVAILKASKEKIENYKEQIEKLKNGIHCANCGGEISHNTLFCPTCGMAVKAAVTVEKTLDESILPCANCGAAMPADRKFCTRCGAPMPRQDFETKPLGNIQSVPITKQCVVCGKTMSQEALFCPGCGKDMRGE